MITIKKSIPQIRAELFSHIEEVQAEYVVKGWLPQYLNLNSGVIRGILEIFIYGIWQLYSFLEYILLQAVPKTSTGAFLDMHAESVDIYRRNESKALGVVEFFRDIENNTNIKIAKGKIIKTKPDGLGNVYRYIVTNDTILTKDATSVLVEVISESYGTAANATVGQICELVTPIQGILRIYNNADWLKSEAANIESDAELFNRYIYRWRAKAGVTIDAYKAAALSINGVADVYINANHPRGQGSIDIYILSTAGAPTENLLLNVKDAVAKEIIINDDVEVFAPNVIEIDITFEIELMFGKAEDVILTAENYVRSYFKALLIGGDIIKDRLASDIVKIEGVKRIVWLKPTTDISIPPSSLGVLKSLNISAIFIADN